MEGGSNGFDRAHRAGGVHAAVHVQPVGPAAGRLQAGVVDAVEEVLERAGHVADVGRGAEQVAVGLEHVGGRRGQGRPDHHLDVVDFVGPRAAHRGLEHLLQGGRRGVVDDQQPRHDRRA